MGFRFFGVLAGLLFAVGGTVGLLQYSLGEFVAGTCHNYDPLLAGKACDVGHWRLLNLCMVVSFALLIAFTYRDHSRRRKHRKRRRLGWSSDNLSAAADMKSSHYNSAYNSAYGSAYSSADDLGLGMGGGRGGSSMSNFGSNWSLPAAAAVEV